MIRHWKITYSHPKDGEQVLSPSLFQEKLDAALRAVPENPRLGHAPAEPRPMPRQKVAAAWLHCLRMSAPQKKLARVAGDLTGTSVSCSLLRKWRTESAFQALIASAQAEIIEALTNVYESGWDHNSWDDEEAFVRFRAELRIFSDWVRVQVGIHAKQMAERAENAVRDACKLPPAEVPTNIEALSIGANRRAHEWTVLVTDFYKDQGGPEWERFRRQLREQVPLTRLVDKFKEIFAAAEKEQNWRWAHDAFTPVAALATAYAQQRDAQIQAQTRRRAVRRPRAVKGARAPIRRGVSASVRAR